MNNNVTYFNSFGVEHIAKETKISRIQAYDSVIGGYFYIGFIDFMLKDKILKEFTNLFSAINLHKNDDIILKYFITNV